MTAVQPSDEDRVPAPAGVEDRSEPPAGYEVDEREDTGWGEGWWVSIPHKGGDIASRETAVALAWAHRDAVLASASQRAAGRYLVAVGDDGAQEWQHLDEWTDEEHWRAMSQEGRSEVLYQEGRHAVGEAADPTPLPEPSIAWMQRAVEANRDTCAWLLELGADDTHENARRIERIAAAQNLPEAAPLPEGARLAEWLDDRAAEANAQANRDGVHPSYRSRHRGRRDAFQGVAVHVRTLLARAEGR